MDAGIGQWRVADAPFGFQWRFSFRFRSSLHYTFRFWFRFHVWFRFRFRFRLRFRFECSFRFHFRSAAHFRTVLFVLLFHLGFHLERAPKGSCDTGIRSFSKINSMLQHNPWFGGICPVEFRGFPLYTDATLGTHMHSASLVAVIATVSSFALVSRGSWGCTRLDWITGWLLLGWSLIQLQQLLPDLFAPLQTSANASRQEPVTTADLEVHLRESWLEVNETRNEKPKRG